MYNAKRCDAMRLKSIYISIWATLIHRWSLSSFGRNSGHLQINNINHFAPFFFFFFGSFLTHILHWFVQILHNLKTLSIADMGVIPYELLVPFGQLKALNLSGNHLVNVSMQILQPVNGLEVSITITACSEFSFFPTHILIRKQIKRQFSVLNCQKINPFIYGHGSAAFFFVFFSLFHWK